MKPGQREWTDNDKNLLKKLKHLPDKELASILDRSLVAVSRMRRNLNIIKNRRFSSEDDSYIKDAYLKHVPIEDIAAHLNRSVGTTRQRILRLGLGREGRRTRLLQRFGEAVALQDKPVEQIAAEQKAKAQAAKAEENIAFTTAVSAALDQMMWNLRNKPATADRREEFKKAMLAGATLQDIGDRMNITRERVR